MKVRFFMLGLLFTGALSAAAKPDSTLNRQTMETRSLTQEWDKTFPQSNRVEHTKVTFHNRYGITLAADLYKPLDATGRLAAVAVSGPYGAVKEQVSGLYAQTHVYLHRYWLCDKEFL